MLDSVCRFRCFQNPDSRKINNLVLISFRLARRRACFRGEPSRRPSGRIISGLSQVQNQVRMMTVREESLAGVMAEVYGRLTRKPGVMIGQGPWVLGNGLLGTLEAFLSSSPMVLLTDFSDAPHFQLHAPYQQATGDWGSWDARRAFGGVTKQVMQAQEPVAAVQATQLAIKHAMSGQPGPVAVLFSHDALAVDVGPDSRPVLYPTRF